MSLVSKFYQVTNFLLLEYRTDQYAVVNQQSTPESERSKYYVYEGHTGIQGVIDISNLQYLQYPDKVQNDYYYPGYNRPTNKLPNLDNAQFQGNLGEADPASSFGEEIVYDTITEVNGKQTQVVTTCGILIKDLYGNSLRESSCLRDSIRIYFTTGYFLNSLQGISLKVEAPVKTVSLTAAAINRLNNSGAQKSDWPVTNRRLGENMTLLDWYLPKSRQPQEAHWLPTAMYYNSKFYDRYIEISFPSPYDLAVNGALRNIEYTYNATWNNPVTKNNEVMQYRGFIDHNSPAIISFATVSDDYTTYIDKTSEECMYSPDKATQIPVTYDSNSKFFNVELFEDEETGTVIYYPVYGEPTLSRKMKPFDLPMMIQIETGTIPMYDRSDQETMNDGIEDFIDAYGTDVFKWCIINELSVTYNYSYIVEQEGQPVVQPYSEYYTNTIDYTGKTSAHGEFWKSKFMPFVQERPYMYCTSIAIRYTAHLYNRMNQREITRTASMIIKDPMKYTRNLINTASVNQYKVINKIIQNPIVVPGNTSAGKVTEKIRRVYYSSNDIVARIGEGGLITTSGNGTLSLKKGPSNYLINMYTTSDINASRTPLDLSGVSKYKIVFPLGVKGQEFSVTTMDDSEQQYYRMGKLMFYLSATDAETIMGFTGDHIFRITTVTSDGTEETTLYTGKVQWERY